MKVTDALEELPYVDPERMGAMGWSYGGYMTMWMQGHTDRFKCHRLDDGPLRPRLVLRRDGGALVPGARPERPAVGLRGLRALVAVELRRRTSRRPRSSITGELDYRVPYTQSLEYFTALQKMGVPSRLVVFPKAGHWPAWYEMAFYYNAHLDFFHQWLGGEPAPWDVVEYAAQGKPPPPAEAAGSSAAAAGAAQR